MRRALAILFCLAAWPVWAGKAKEDAGLRSRAVSQAREILGVRQSLLAHLQAHYPEVKVEQSPGDLAFFIPPSALFPDSGTALSPSGATLMGVLRDLANTYRSLYVTIGCEKGAAVGDALKANTRRAVGLGSAVFRQWGVPPGNIYLRLHPSVKEGFQFDFRTKKPEPLPSEQELTSVMIHLRDPVLKFGVNPLLPIDVSLLARSGVRRWSLRLINTDTGGAVKEFSGTSDLWVSLQGDGRDKNGAPVAAGEYQAFLTAVGYGREPMTDSVGFVVKDPPGRLSPPAVVKPKPVRRAPVPTPPAPPVKPPPAAESRRWAFVVRFARDSSDLAGSAALEIRQLAATLKTFPEEQAVVEGFADPDEREPRSLAAQRARVVKDQLVKQFDVSGDRLIVRSQEPRAPLEGETMHKTVAFFVGAGEP